MAKSYPIQQVSRRRRKMPYQEVSRGVALFRLPRLAFSLLLCLVVACSVSYVTAIERSGHNQYGHLQPNTKEALTAELAQPLFVQQRYLAKLANNQPPDIIASNTLEVAYYYSGRDANNNESPKVVLIQPDFFTANGAKVPEVATFADTIRAERKRRRVKTNLVLARFGVVVDGPSSPAGNLDNRYRSLSIFTPTANTLANTLAQGTVGFFQSSLSEDFSVAGATAMKGDAAAGDKSTFLAFLGAQINSLNRERAKSLYTKVQSVVDAVLKRARGSVPDITDDELDSDEAVFALIKELEIELADKSISETWGRSLASAFYHSEQALLAYLWRVGRVCTDPYARSGACTLTPALRSLGNDICHIKMMVLDIISIPNTVCSNCNYGLSLHWFKRYFDQAVQDLQTELCTKTRSKPTGQLDLLIRTQGDRPFQGGPLGRRIADQRPVLRSQLPVPSTWIIHKLPPGAKRKDAPDPERPAKRPKLNHPQVVAAPNGVGDPNVVQLRRKF